jgi:hypothetical protein
MVWDHEVVGSNPTAPTLHIRIIVRVEAEVLWLVVGAPFSSFKKTLKRDPRKINEIKDSGFCGTNPTAPIFLKSEYRNPKLETNSKH